jgi:hypothetical protein
MKREQQQGLRLRGSAWRREKRTVSAQRVLLQPKIWAIGQTALLRYRCWSPGLDLYFQRKHAVAVIYSSTVNDSKWTVEEAGKDFEVSMEVSQWLV